MARAVGQLMECGGVVLFHAGKLLPERKHDTVSGGAVICLVSLPVLQLHPGAGQVSRYDLVGGAIGDGIVRFRADGGGLDVVHLGDVEDIVILQQRDQLLRLFPGGGVRFPDLLLFPEDHHGSLFALADFAAQALHLVEGVPGTGLAQKHLVQKAVGLARNARYCAGLEARPGLAPGDLTLLQLLDDAGGDRFVDVECHAMLLLLTSEGRRCYNGPASPVWGGVRVFASCFGRR